MGQISVEIYERTGSVLSGNQQQPDRQRMQQVAAYRARRSKNQGICGCPNDTRYRDMLIEEASATGSRVHFCGSLPDEQFLSAIAVCDAVVMPYREVGLSSSGPISLALELGKRIVASRIKAFEGFSHYYPERIEFFLPGDERHLAMQLASPVNTPAISTTELSPFQRNIDVYRRALLGLLNNASP